MARIALAGGGTGGHVYPALAIGDVLRGRGHEVVYYGDPERLEGRVAPERGYVFRPVSAFQYPRSGGILGKMVFAWRLLRSSWAMRGVLAADRIDLVLGVGGYISAPPVLAAWSMRKKSALHEANVVPGLANRLCARVVDAVLLSFEDTRNLPGKAPRHVVGVPVNPKVLSGQRADARERYGLDPARPIVLFVGGSLGAARLNELAIACMKRTDRSWQILHITGPKLYSEVMAQVGTPPAGVCVRDYENQMGTAYAAADLVVCRAGSATLAELAALGLPSVLIPSPNVTDDHQTANARALESLGAALVLTETSWDLDASMDAIASLGADAGRLKAMSAAARTQAKLNAADQAADVIEGLLR